MGKFTPGSWVWNQDRSALIGRHTILFVDRWWNNSHGDAALIAASPELLEALTKCRDVFMRYAELHAAKGTPEGVEKAKANHDLATMCEAAISRATQTEGK